MPTTCTAHRQHVYAIHEGDVNGPTDAGPALYRGDDRHATVLELVEVDREGIEAYAVAESLTRGVTQYCRTETTAVESLATRLVLAS